MRYLAFLLIFALLIGFPAIGTAKASTIITVSAPDQQIASGETFTVSINFNLDTAIAGAQFDLTFDPSIVTVDSVQKGDLLAPEEPIVYFDPGKIDNDNGTISEVIGVVMTPGQTLPENGSIAIITFTAREKDNISPLNLSNVVLGDAEGQPVPVSILRNDEITVGVNHPPILKIGDKSIKQGQLLEFTISATDPDNDTLIYSASNLPPGARFDFETRTFSWTPTQVETYTGVHFQVFDGEFVDSQDISITVSASSDYIGSGVGGGTVTSGGSAVIVGGGAIGGGVPAGWGGVPPVSGGGVAAVVGGSVIGTTGSGYCSDGTPCGWCSSTQPKECTSEILIDNCSKCGCPPGLECQPDGTCSEPVHTDDSDTSSGSDNFITNNTNNTATNTETNQAPVLNSIGNQSIDEGQQLQFTITATDPNGDDLTYSASNLPSGANFDSQTRIFTWIPDSSQTGGSNVSFEVSDGQFSDSENITITVNEDHQYYVAINGNDSNPGSYQKPWRTITKAANTLIAGDTVYVKSGTYYEQISPQNSGSAGNWITYAAYPGDTVTIDGTGRSLSCYNGLFDIRNQNYIVIEGFNIGHAHGDGGDYKQNNSSAGSAVFGRESDHIAVRDCYIFDCGGAGIQFLGCSNLLIDNNELSDCTDQGDQECISLLRSHNFEISNNYVHDLAYSRWYYCSVWGPKECIDVKAGSHTGSIHDNHTVGGRVGIYVDGHRQDAYDIDIYNNHCEDFMDRGIYINGENGGSDIYNINIYNNVIHDSTNENLTCFCGDGITLGGETDSFDNIRIINNTVYNVQDAPLLIDKGGDNVTDLYVRNNIFWGDNPSYGSVYYDEGKNNAENGYNPAEHVFSNNCYGDQGPGYHASYFGTDYVTADPQFVSASPDCAVDGFELQSNSPLIDAGTSTDAPGTDYNGNSRPSGSAYDIGAYEFR